MLQLFWWRIRSDCDQLLPGSGQAAHQAQALLHPVRSPQHVTARKRNSLPPTVPLPPPPLPSPGQVGILFGREDNGLYNSEVAKADRLLTIDSDPDFYSLNLGQAVLLVAYQLHRGRARRRAVTPARRRASKGEQAQVVDELLGALEARGHWGDSNREAGQVGGWGGYG